MFIIVSPISYAFKMFFKTNPDICACAFVLRQQVGKVGQWVEGIRVFITEEMEKSFLAIRSVTSQ